MMDRRLIGLGVALVATFALASLARAERAMLGRYSPIAVEPSARVVWTNPANAILSAGSSVLCEAVWEDGWSSGLEPGEVTTLNLAAGTDRATYGFQKNLGDVPGRPDWTFAISAPRAIGRRSSIGLGFEYRRGEDSGLDGTFGWTSFLSRDFRVAATVENVFETVDGAPRTGNGGAAWQRSGLGYLSWDSVWRDGENPISWVGVGIDRLRVARLSFHTTLDGDWTAFVSIGNRQALGGGVREVDERRAARFASWDWRPAPNRTP
ncbi:MAG: hypothetical protein R3B81_17765 [bacterium]